MKRVVDVVFFLSLVTSLFGQPNANARQYNQTEQDLIRVERDYYAIPFGDRYIWGITAGILRNLYERIYGS